MTTKVKSPFSFCFITLSWIILQQSSYDVQAQKIPCVDDVECENRVGRGSICLRPDENMFGSDSFLDGIEYHCSNPFEQGCLYNLLPDWKKKRVCNSDDPANAEDLGICRKPDIDDYLEVRIFSENWESISFISWILQIILSELLGVPTTLETGTPTAKKNFYDPVNSFDYGIAFPLDRGSLVVATEVGGDCGLIKAQNDNITATGEGEYKACSHIIPEAWEANDEIAQLIRNGTLEDDRAVGANGQEAWFVTKFTAEKYPSLVSYLGLQGEENRKNLAKIFKRPTTWLEYCEQVSINNCTNGGDAVAKRPPHDDREASRMFADGLYTGHFRKTEENDCDTFPTSCTGHIADYPCGWSSNTEQQAYHLDIALRSSGNDGARGYSYGQMVDMWRAANATKSHLMMVWWTPEPLVQSFLGTDAEFQRVLLPTATQECFDAKVGPGERCDESLDVRVGDPLGVCDYIPQNLYKRMSSSLYDAIHDPSIPDAIRSPAHSVLQSFTISELQLDELFDLWKSRPTPREAVCQWSVDNIDYLEKFVPRNYPRVLRKEVSTAERVLEVVALVVGAITILLVVLTTGMVYKHREDRSIRIAQIEFLWILLAGLFLISIGAIVNGMKRSNMTCIVSIWFINAGFTLELVPLIVKVAAINRMAVAAKKMRRVTIDRTSLYKAVALLFLLIVIYLTVWTVLDPPNKEPEYNISSFASSGEDTIVSVSHYCSSNSDVWRYVAVGWICILLLCATVLAYQMRNLVKDFNESWTLAIMIYSHLMFVILRVITFVLTDYVSGSLLQQLQSYIYCGDVMVTVILYFLPKFIKNKNENRSAYASEFSRPWASSHAPGALSTFDPASAHGGGAMNPYDRSAAAIMASKRIVNNNSNSMNKLSTIDHGTDPEDVDDSEGKKPQQQYEHNKYNSNNNKQEHHNTICCSQCGRSTVCPHCADETKSFITSDYDDDDYVDDDFADAAESESEFG